MNALKAILSRGGVAAPGLSVLDIGCGDGYAISELTGVLPSARVAAVDTGLSETQAAELSAAYPGIDFHRAYDALAGRRYDLVLLLDVLEHVDDDRAFLSDLAARFASPGGLFLVTAPAFDRLMSAHDRFLGHRRRYGLGTLRSLARAAGLEPLQGGYLFQPLLVTRSLSALIQAAGVPVKPVGVGSWRVGRAATMIIERLLTANNAFFLLLGRIGVKVPGLTAWTLCRRQPS